MMFNPHTPADRAAMLATIGADTVEDLFAPVDEAVRFPTLNLPPVLTEMEATERLGELAERNLAPKAGSSFLGAGSYHHFVPATVGQILARGEFYTAYTPYQPEVAQGTLQVIYEFQSLVAALLGMEVANASIYDGATALAEGALIAVSASRKKNRIVVSGTVHPAYRAVLRTYLSGTGVELVELPVPTTGFVTQPEDFAPYLGDGLAAVVVQYPNFFGGIEDVRAMGKAAHAAGGSLVVSTYPVPLGLLTSPGELGADVVAAEGQALGVAQSFGGPYVGLLATRKQFVRQMPGRLAGMTTDSEGKRGFVLTLQTREQHIRREKATSNICTNQGLMATAATVYMASLGPRGFREVATRCYQNAHYLADRLAALPGFELALEVPFFHEFVVRTPEPVAAINARLVEAGVIGGYDLAAVDPSLERHMLICATELNGRASVDRLVGLLAG
ncbi:MAG: Glycine dehydrogenase [decarboxylating] (glycine cleavage system P1 protein) [uncultured Thermomicrobiales bacterium]|uniref:Probable glycine dehydrogenase (decarboxylating) subunit 1 n=1 Tax=uncultured Thermomicrobiales bacterium TaxID=1645740 RepID=A0A6J4UE45_9BACT|nr:MAG: Glycine dehydrogenase [decarboxylating] (glycine cleavage system P1 protein) [uncultured Thermomicrobiales bacterium]